MLLFCGSQKNNGSAMVVIFINQERWRCWYDKIRDSVNGNDIRIVQDGITIFGMIEYRLLYRYYNLYC